MAGYSTVRRLRWKAAITAAQSVGARGSQRPRTARNRHRLGLAAPTAQQRRQRHQPPCPPPEAVLAEVRHRQHQREVHRRHRMDVRQQPARQEDPQHRNRPPAGQHRQRQAAASRPARPSPAGPWPACPSPSSCRRGRRSPPSTAAPSRTPPTSSGTGATAGHTCPAGTPAPAARPAGGRAAADRPARWPGRPRGDTTARRGRRIATGRWSRTPGRARTAPRGAQLRTISTATLTCSSLRIGSRSANRAVTTAVVARMATASLCRALGTGIIFSGLIVSSRPPANNVRRAEARRTERRWRTNRRPAA